MTKEKYLDQLKQRLHGLPDTEINDALDYYDGYISDAEGGEEEAVAALGSPGEAAAHILANYVTSGRRSKSKAKNLKAVWSVILAVFAIPVGLPVAAAVAVVAVALLISLFAVIISFWAGGAAAVFAGVVYALMSVVVMTKDAAYALLIAGMGFAGAGIGILMFLAANAMFGRGLKVISKFVGKVILKSGKKIHNVKKTA
ncbi:MAG: DUF1700 domain-containing protein [Defluviitaleaceae bacterium]|nr:DUF1700 domain-containing protein [Defluviitaleaceae bacterium]